MAKTQEFFETYLPNKLKENPELASIGSVFQFNIDGAGQWYLDAANSTVAAGEHGSPDCVLTASQDTWEGILDNPSSAFQAVMMQKLKISNLALATKLQQILA